MSALDPRSKPWSRIQKVSPSQRHRESGCLPGTPQHTHCPRLQQGTPQGLCRVAGAQLDTGALITSIIAHWGQRRGGEPAQRLPCHCTAPTLLGQLHTHKSQGRGTHVFRETHPEEDLLPPPAQGCVLPARPGPLPAPQGRGCSGPKSHRKGHPARTPHKLHDLGQFFPRFPLSAVTGWHKLLTCSPFPPWRREPSEVPLCWQASPPHTVLFHQKPYSTQIKHPIAPKQQLLPTPLPRQGCQGLCNMFTRTLTSSFSSCNTVKSAGTAVSERSGGERASRAARMPSQGSRLLAGCSGARGERSSFREGRSAGPQGRCLRWGDPTPGARNGSSPAVSLQEPWCRQYQPCRPSGKGREGKNTYLSAIWHGFPRKSLALLCGGASTVIQGCSRSP